MRVLRADVAAKLMREVLLESLLNQHGIPLKDWKNSPAFDEKIARQFEDHCKKYQNSGRMNKGRYGRKRQRSIAIDDHGQERR